MLLILILVFFAAACILTIIIFISFGVHDYRQEMAWRETLTPLPSDTIEYLCSTFELNPSDRRCKPSKEIYSYQYYEEIVLSYFRDRPNYDPTRPTYIEIEKLFGRYNQGCTYYEEYEDTFCFYDFSGKDEDPITLYFDQDGILQAFHTRHWD